MPTRLPTYEQQSRDQNKHRDGDQGEDKQAAFIPMPEPQISQLKVVRVGRAVGQDLARRTKQDVGSAHLGRDTGGRRSLPLDSRVRARLVDPWPIDFVLIPDRLGLVAVLEPFLQGRIAAL